MGQYWSHWSQARKVSAEELADLGVTKPKEVFKFLEGMIPRHNQIMETDYPRMYDYTVQAQAQMNNYQNQLSQLSFGQFNPTNVSVSSSDVWYMTYEESKAWVAEQKARKLDDPVQWLKGRVKEMLWYSS